jgi:hypothetical protein
MGCVTRGDGTTGGETLILGLTGKGSGLGLGVGLLGCCPLERLVCLDVCSALDASLTAVSMIFSRIPALFSSR